MQALDDYAVVQDGDLMVFSLGTDRVADWASTHNELGKTVDEVRAAYSCRPNLQVYRKMPVPTNGHAEGHVRSVPAVHDSTIGVGAQARRFFIPQDDESRKSAPLFRGLLGYFPAALFAVAAHSLASDQKHNPDNPDAPKWTRGKSSDHADCIVRHLIDAGTRETVSKDERLYHLTAAAWRALAQLQEEHEYHGAEVSPRSVNCKNEGR